MINPHLKKTPIHHDALRYTPDPGPADPHPRHETVYPIDVRLTLNDEALGPVIGANPKYQAKMGELQQLGQTAMAQMGQWLAEGAICRIVLPSAAKSVSVLGRSDIH